TKTTIFMSVVDLPALVCAALVDGRGRGRVRGFSPRVPNTRTEFGGGWALTPSPAAVSCALALHTKCYWLVAFGATALRTPLWEGYDQVRSRTTPTVRRSGPRPEPTAPRTPPGTARPG